MVTSGTGPSSTGYQQPPGLTQPHPLRGGLGFTFKDREEAEVGTRGLLREQRQRGGSGQSTRRTSGEGQGQGRFREQEAEVQAFVQQSSIEG